MARTLWWWTVSTDCGTWRTLAASRAKAVRNARYRLVMAGRSYGRPSARDFAAMRDIEVLGVRRDEDATAGASGGPAPRWRFGR